VASAKTVQQDDHGPISRTFVDDIEDQLTVTVLIHALSIDHHTTADRGSGHPPILWLGSTPELDRV
jgi:hypothetical protein